MAKPSKKKKVPPKVVESKPVETQEIRPAQSGPIYWKTFLQAAIIIATGLWIYSPALHGEWLWDDDQLVTANSSLHNLQGLGKIWDTVPTSDYWPLTWTTLWIEWHLWGNEPLGYHLCSLFLHLLSGFLIWRLFDRFGLRWGWLGGLLFVIHPLAVESVAWIAEIKNTLSLPFYLLAFHAWLDAEEKKPLGYARSVFYYLAAMLAKTSTVMLPLVLLLYCWWKRGCVTRRELKHMVPYLAIALVLGLVTVYFQNHKQGNNPVELGSFVTRSIGAGTALFFYLGKFILPVDLLPIYPQWTLTPPSFLQVLTIPALAGLLGGLWVQRKGWGRHALFGFGFFLLNLLPVLGFVRMSYMSISGVADHLAYLPIIGLIGLVVAALGRIDVATSFLQRPLGAGILAVVLALLLLDSHVYASRFVSQETLWTYTVARNPGAWLAHNNLGNVYLEQGRSTEAIEQYQQALQITPMLVDANNNLGVAFEQLQRPDEAIPYFEAALKINPHFAKAHVNLANTLSQVGQTSAAIAHYQEALRINPHYAEARTNLDKLLTEPNRK